MSNIGLVGLSMTKGSFVSKAIWWFRKPFSNSDFIPSHVFVTIGSILGKDLLWEITDPKIRIYPLENYLVNKNKRIELWEIQNIDLRTKKKVLSELLKLSGKTYGYLQLFGFSLISLGKKLGLNLNNPINIERELVCSEGVYKYLEEIGYIEGMNSNNVAPDTILKILKETGNAKLVAVKEYNSAELKRL